MGERRGKEKLQEKAKRKKHKGSTQTYVKPKARRKQKKGIRKN